MSVIILTLYGLLIKKTLDMKDYWLLVVIVLTLIRACIEPFIVTIEQNVFLIFFALLMFDKTKVEDKLDS